MSKVTEYREQIAKLEQALKQELKTGRATALADVRAQIKEYGFTQTELKSVIKARKKRTPKAATSAAVKVTAKNAATKQGPKKS